MVRGLWDLKLLRIEEEVLWNKKLFDFSKLKKKEVLRRAPKMEVWELEPPSGISLNRHSKTTKMKMSYIQATQKSLQI